MDIPTPIIILRPYPSTTTEAPTTIIFLAPVSTLPSDIYVTPSATPLKIYLIASPMPLPTACINSPNPLATSFKTLTNLVSLLAPLGGLALGVVPPAPVVPLFTAEVVVLPVALVISSVTVDLFLPVIFPSMLPPTPVALPKISFIPEKRPLKSFPPPSICTAATRLVTPKARFIVASTHAGN